MTQMQRWEPLPVGTHTHDSNIDGRIVITISADGEYIGVVGSEEGDREYVNLYPPGKYRLCRLVPAAEVGVPSEVVEATELLTRMLEVYSPEHHYEMGKVGYECAFCKTLFERIKTFADPYNHKEDCAWANAQTWLDTQKGE